jgi:Spy/CpxP family protein refolding chaperone
MSRLRFLVVSTLVMFALIAVAQPTQNASDAAAPSVDRHLQLLSEKLDLTSDQQAKARPILQEMSDSTQKFMQDESMSRDERMDNVKASRYRADRKLREILNEGQKKKLDQLEAESHP